MNSLLIILGSKQCVIYRNHVERTNIFKFELKFLATKGHWRDLSLDLEIVE